MAAAIVHVPAVTKATVPLEESIVQTPEVALEKLFAPPPAETDDVMVGGASVVMYVAVKLPESIVRPRGFSVTENEMLGEVAAPKVIPELMAAVTVQFPAARKDTAPDTESMVQIAVEELEKLFVPSPSPAEAVAVIVGGAESNV
jgi:hypothetical protein